MAHGDYNCCARCDSKMTYSDFASTKEEICAECAVDLIALTGERITTGEALAAYVARSEPDKVRALNVATCFYSNPVDKAVAMILETSPREDTKS